MTMKRRAFLSQARTALGGLMTLAAFGQQSSPAGNADSRPRLRWNRDGNSRLFAAVSWVGAPLVRGDAPGLLDGACRLCVAFPAHVGDTNETGPPSWRRSWRLEWLA